MGTLTLVISAGLLIAFGGIATAVLGRLPLSFLERAQEHGRYARLGEQEVAAEGGGAGRKRPASGPQPKQAPSFTPA